VGFQLPRSILSFFQGFKQVDHIQQVTRDLLAGIPFRAPLHNDEGRKAGDAQSGKLPWQGLVSDVFVSLSFIYSSFFGCIVFHPILRRFFLSVVCYTHNHLYHPKVVQVSAAASCMFFCPQLRPQLTYLPSDPYTTTHPQQVRLVQVRGLAWRG